MGNLAAVGAGAVAVKQIADAVVAGSRCRKRLRLSSKAHGGYLGRALLGKGEIVITNASQRPLRLHVEKDLVTDVESEHLQPGEKAAFARRGDTLVCIDGHPHVLQPHHLYVRGSSIELQQFTLDEDGGLYADCREA